MQYMHSVSSDAGPMAGKPRLLRSTPMAVTMPDLRSFDAG